MSDAPLDLSPRPAGTGRTARPKRRWGVGAVLAVVLAAAAFVVFKGLSEATVYFCNADEVGVRTGCREGRFRVQGVVDDGTLARTAGGLDFTLSFNGATVPVSYSGAEPSDMFQEGIAVVVEGRLESGQSDGGGSGGVSAAGDEAAAGATFAGDRILVKHSAEYTEENPDRVSQDAP